VPYCPSCREEYDPGIEQCADCLVPLEETLAPEQQEEEKAGSKVDVPGAACPTQLKNRIPVPDTEEAVSGEIQESDLINLPLAEIMRMGVEVIDELMRLVINGTPVICKRAATLLSLMGSSGAEALQKLVKVALEKDRTTIVTIVGGTLRGTEFDTDLWKEFVPYLEGSNSVRIKALELIGHFGDLAAVPLVMPYLDDADPEVRDEADNTLCVLSDEDMGFETDASPADRQKKISMWQEWWRAQEMEQA